jgi:hypothetical protein
MSKIGLDISLGHGILFRFTGRNLKIGNKK